MYKKWDKLEGDSDDEDQTNPQSQRHFDPMAIATAAKMRVEQARADGREPNPMDVMAAKAQEKLGGKDPFANMSESSKQQFLDRLNNPDVLKQVKQAAAPEQVKQATAVEESYEPRAQSTEAAFELIGKALGLVDKRVVVCGVKSQPELNGKAGRCTQYDADRGRCVVLLDGQGKGKLFKVENLRAETGGAADSQ